MCGASGEAGVGGARAFKLPPLEERRAMLKKESVAGVLLSCLLALVTRYQAGSEASRPEASEDEKAGYALLSSRKSRADIGYWLLFDLVFA